MKTLFGILAAHVLIFLLGLALLGWELLGLTLVFGLPLGNFLAWTGMMTLAALVLKLYPSGLGWGVMGWTLLGLAIAWLPFSLLIFQNPQFSGTTPFWWAVWLRYSVGMMVVLTILLFLNGIWRLWQR